MKAAVVTGVSSGIGNATSRALLDRGYHVFGSVRREADAAPLAEAYPGKFLPLVFDVTDTAAIEAAARLVSERIGNAYLSGLVNNAGIGISGPVLLQPMDEIRKHFDINVLGPISVVRAFAGMLGGDEGRSGPKGRIVNITSIAGKFVGPFFGAYAGSKHALEAYTDAMRRELMLYGIDVVAVGPGGVDTPITHKGEAHMGAYSGTEFGAAIHATETELIARIRDGYSPDFVGRAIADILTVKSPKVRYALVKSKLRDWTIPMSLPKRIVDRVMAKNFGLAPENRKYAKES
ncbi:MAG: SDR family NAD(P)-dependent oxidoreductase [Sphingobium sp.]|jgi:NAD(P)-dependent dehydrogenase (short-subunit alcohol dehydrogenase family)|nr:SDR family NAD(P)-dependent oxidoreductase [Sphingobium sp.]MCI1754644.1 SDR family NAD(P)-dependent oxidoreductase [Sphingobium sp.]MCI2054184.1 SDR family NAD(P)-dependent oxidoreductase [Sphingobium sp.]